MRRVEGCDKLDQIWNWRIVFQKLAPASNVEIVGGMTDWLALLLNGTQLKLQRGPLMELVMFYLKRTF